MRGRSTRWLVGSRQKLPALALLTCFGVGEPLLNPVAHADAKTMRADNHASERASCLGDLRLVASMVIEARPDLSRAVFRQAAGAGAHMVSVGGRIADYTLVSLEPDRAHFRSTRGAECTLSVFSSRAARAEEALSPPPAPANEPASPNAEPPKGKAVFTREELSGGVRALGGDRYRIAKPLFLRALTNPGGAASGAYFKAVERDGHTVGMEVKGVREHSALNAMGIRTGDVVRSVNGISLDNAVELLGAFRAAREADAVSIEITRDGQERVLQYLIE